MSHRTRRPHDSEVSLPARLADVTTGAPTEASDRRSISIYAMFAIDEPHDALSSLDDGICAFLPSACTDTWTKSR